MASRDSDDPPVNRRDFLTGVASTALAYALDARTQTAGSATNITLRIGDLAVLDPARSTGPWQQCHHVSSSG
jgi:hypothetical protein